MDRQWSFAALARLRFPLTAASLILLVLAVGVTRTSQDAVAPPAQPKPWPLPNPAPAPPQPVSSKCRSSDTDTVSRGVTPTAIRVASTVTLDGPGASLLSTSPVGMRAVVNRINRAGGVCTRRIELTTVNDSWDADRSHAIVRRFIAEDYFALVGMPGSEGLVAALRHGDIEEAGIPVVGTSGLTDAEFASPWVWPVGTATSSIMRIIASDAKARGARSFALLRDAHRQFAHDGAAALRAAVKRSGGQLVADIALDPAEGLGDKAQEFERACSRTARRCDAVVLLLTPDTALAWRAVNPGGKGRAGPGGLTYGAQTLFTDDFASACAQWCDRIEAWTSFEPAMPGPDPKIEVASFAQHVTGERMGIDVRNHFLQGAYVGMTVFAEAAALCSPDLTRDCLRDALDTTEFDSDLVNTLRWDPNGRHANISAQPFVIDAAGDAFRGWRSPEAGWFKDPAF